MVTVSDSVSVSSKKETIESLTAKLEQVQLGVEEVRSDNSELRKKLEKSEKNNAELEEVMDKIRRLTRRM